MTKIFLAASRLPSEKNAKTSKGVKPLGFKNANKSKRLVSAGN